MTTALKGLEFDPGFAPHILAFEGTVSYLYTDINRFKNFSQKKLKFRQYYKKILDIFYNNLGFYAGCLMWAAYILAQPEQEILSNSCLGMEYDEEANIADTQYMLQFAELFHKDMKYFLNETFEFSDKEIKLLKLYEEFLILNRGFVESKLNTDIKLPKSLKIADVNVWKSEIDKSIQTGDLSALFNVIEV